VGITAAAFRDGKMEAFAVIYDWVAQSHLAEISVRSNDGAMHKYRIVGLSQVIVSEDFDHIEEIEFCTLITSPGRIYLSLDPYAEGVESDRDNFSFAGREIMKVD
jgi:hypothetical protein